MKNSHSNILIEPKAVSSNFSYKSSNLFKNYNALKTLGFRILKANPKRIGFLCDLARRKFKLFEGFNTIQSLLREIATVSHADHYQYGSFEASKSLHTAHRAKTAPSVYLKEYILCHPCE